MKPPLIATELRTHAPFTAFGTVTGIVGIMAAFIQLHVLLSALVATAMYRVNAGRGIRRTILIGYLGSVGIATLSDSLIPFAGEWLLDLPHSGIHLSFIEKWWLVNPLALAGIALLFRIPYQDIPCGTCALEHLGVAVSPHHGAGRPHRCRHHDIDCRFFISGGLGALLYQRYCLSTFVGG